MKIFVLSCDGAPLPLVRRWAQEGRLPGFARLLGEGASGELESVFPPITGPAWTSFLTGRNPAKHGIGDWYLRAEDSYRLRPADSSSIACSTIWDELREGGKRLVSLGLPMNYPPPRVNGMVVSGLETPGSGCATFPEEARHEVMKAVPEFRTHLREAYRPQNADRVVDDLLEITDIQSRLAHHFLPRDDWDLFVLHHQSCDWAMHFFWHAMDPEHPRFTEDQHRRYGDTILRVFQRIDQGLQRCLELLPPETATLVISDHGFGVLDKYLYLNNWLMELDLLRLRHNLTSRVQQAIFRAGFTPSRVYRVAERTGLNKFAFRMGKADRYDLLSRLFLSQDNIDWPTTTAYSVGNIGQIFVNLKGREPQGRVMPGADYERVRDRIIEAALELEDPQSGTKVISQAVRKEQVYQGPHLDAMADVLLYPTGFRYQAGGLSQFMSNRIMEPSFAYTGGHRMHGTLIMHGTGVKPGRVEGASLIDLAPTILHILGLPVPDDMDGAVLTEALSVEQAVAQREGSATSETHDGGYTPDEEREIARRLRSLGYVE